MGQYWILQRDQVYTVYIDVRLLMIWLIYVKCLPGGSAIARCVYPYFSTASPIFRCRFCLSRRMRSEKLFSRSGLFTYRRLFGISGMSFFKASNQPGRKLILSEDRLDLDVPPDRLFPDSPLHEPAVSFSAFTLFPLNCLSTQSGVRQGWGFSFPAIAWQLLHFQSPGFLSRTPGSGSGRRTGTPQGDGSPSGSEWLYPCPARGGRSCCAVH